MGLFALRRVSRASCGEGGESRCRSGQGNLMLCNMGSWRRHNTTTTPHACVLYHIGDARPHSPHSPAQAILDGVRDICRDLAAVGGTVIFNIGGCWEREGRPGFPCFPYSIVGGSTLTNQGPWICLYGRAYLWLFLAPCLNPKTPLMLLTTFVYAHMDGIPTDLITSHWPTSQQTSIPDIVWESRVQYSRVREIAG